MVKEPLTPYQRRLILFLSVATFFEGYDFIALSQILPDLREAFGMSEFLTGFLIMVVNSGTVVAYLMVKKADRWGRKRVLTVTIFGYAFFTLMSGLSTFVIWAPMVHVALFGLCQMAARIFLIGEYATTVVVASEEFPASRRGMVLGVLQAISSFGSILCVGLVPLFAKTAIGWRLVYFVGVVPLLLIAYARRGLKETRRFQELSGAEREASSQRSFFEIFRTPHRKRLLELACLWFLTYIPMNNAVLFWKDHANNALGWHHSESGGALMIAALGAMPLLFSVGKMFDKLGRRPSAAIIFSAATVGVAGSYLFTSFVLVTASLLLAIFSVSAYLPMLSGYTAELFPTEYRGDAFAWANNIIGRSSYVISPLILGWVAESIGWAHAIAPTSLLCLVAIFLVYRWLPETTGRELEDTAEA